MRILKTLCLSALICVGMNLSASANDGYGHHNDGYGGGYTSGGCGGGCGFKLFRGLSYNCNRAPTYEYGAALWDNYCDHRHDDYGDDCGGGCGLFGGLFGGGCGGGSFGGSCFGYPGQDCCGCDSGCGGGGQCGDGGCGGGFLRARLGGGFRGGCGSTSGCGGGVFSRVFGGGGNFGGGCFGYPGQDCCGCGGYGVSYNSGGCGIGGRHGLSVFGFQRRSFHQGNSYGSCGYDSYSGCNQCGSQSGNCGCGGAVQNGAVNYSNGQQPVIQQQPTPAPVQNLSTPVQQPTPLVQPNPEGQNQVQELDSFDTPANDDGSGIR